MPNCETQPPASIGWVTLSSLMFVSLATCQCHILSYIPSIWVSHSCTKSSFDQSLCWTSKSWNHLRVGMETPQNRFQVYRPINVGHSSQKWNQFVEIPPCLNIPSNTKNRLQSSVYVSINQNIIPMETLHTILQVLLTLENPTPNLVEIGTGYSTSFPLTFTKILGDIKQIAAFERKT